VVLEARNRVGGRMLNSPLPGAPGEIVESGGQWVGPGQDAIAALLTEYGLATFPTHNAGRHLLEWRGTLRRYKGEVPKLDPVTLVDVGQAQWRLERAARRLPAGAPWAGRDAARLDGETFAAWIHRTCRTAGGRRFFTVLAEAVFSADAEAMSALWAAAYVGAAGGLNPLVQTRGGGQQDRVVGGSYLLAERMADKLGERILLGAPARHVAHDADGVTVTYDHGTVRARHAIIAVPPPLQRELGFAPALPADRGILLDRLPMGAVIKFNVVYDTPFWRADGLSGQAASVDSPVGIVYDNTPPAGTPGVLVAFVEARHARHAAGLDPAGRRDLVLAGLARLFGPKARAAGPIVEQDWVAEEWTRGCYGAFAVPDTLVRYGPALRRPVGRIHWAGAETATRWTGYLDGAVSSGRRAAAEVSDDTA